MHVGLIIPSFAPRRGGAEGYAASVFRRLVEAYGVRLDVFTRTRSRSGDAAIDGPVRIRHTPNAEALDAAIAESAPDLTVDWGLHHPADLHRLGGGIHRAFLRYNLLGCSLVARLWKQHVEYKLPRHRRELRREQTLLEQPNTHFLAVSRFVAEQVLESAPVAEGRITVLHNGVDIHRFHPAATPEERHAARRRLEIEPGGGPLFLFVGHNLHRKNFALIQAVFTPLAREFPDVRVLVLGRRRPRGHAPWLHFLGPRDAPEIVYRAADAMLHPAWYDPCSNAVLEALASGLPVVASDYNGSSEIIASGENGYVLPVRADARESVVPHWMAVVRRLIVDEDHRRNLGAAARELAEAHPLEHYVRRFLALLKKVAERRG